MTRDSSYLEQQVYCDGCKGKRNHKIIFTYEENAHYFDQDFQWHAQYHIVKCAGCDKVAFVKQYGDEDTWEYVGEERVWVDIFTVYPEEPKEEISKGIWWEGHKLEVKTFNYAPITLINLYEQIIESYNNKHFILCTSGLRTLIEGICSQQGIKKGFIYDEEKNKLPNKDGVIAKSESLGGRIFGLYENDYITFLQAQILQKVKVIGNSAIHDIVVPKAVTIKEIIRILERIMDDVYELENHVLLKKSEKENKKV